MSIITGWLSVYIMVNTRRAACFLKESSLMFSMIYGYNVSKLFIVSILGTRLLGDEEIYFCPKACSNSFYRPL
jgi:hypothetical protein